MTMSEVEVDRITQRVFQAHNSGLNGALVSVVVDEIENATKEQRAKVAAASRWVNRFSEFLEDDCDPCEGICHGFDVTDDGRCSLAADLDNLRAIIRGES